MTTLLATLTLSTAQAQSYDWAPMALVSETMGIQANRLCVGEATRGDVGCPTTAPSLTTAGDVSVSGNLSAAKFIGDGSGLTGLAASNVSITTGASGSLVFRDGFGSLMASSGLSISATTGSVGIGAGAPAYLGNNGLYTQGSVYANGNSYANGTFGLGGSNLGMSGNGPAQYLTFLTSNTEALRIVSTGNVGIGTPYPSSTLHVNGTIRIADVGGLTLTNRGQINTGVGTGDIKVSANGDIQLQAASKGVAVGSSLFTPSQTLHVSGTTLTTSWTGINFSNALNVTPTSPLEVSGTVSATALVINGLSISATTSSLRFKPGTGNTLSFQRYGDPLWMADTWYDTTNSSTEAFRIGTSNLNPAWLIRATNGYPIVLNTISGSVVPGVAVGGWGLNWPSTLSATLFVKGSQITTSWTSIGFNDSSRTATVPLEVSGTISATALIINGQSITSGGVTTFASLTDVSYSAVGGNIFGPGSLTGAVNGVTNSTAVGHYALRLNTTGYNNSGYGRSALQALSTGIGNTAVGYNAAFSTNGTNNTAIGAAVMEFNTGSSNVATGYGALSFGAANNNTAMGYLSGRFATGGMNTILGLQAGNGVSNSSTYQYSTLVGAYAGQGLTSGNNNVMIGWNSGAGITTGSSNTVIGTSVSPYSNTGSNQLAIANAIWGDVGNGNTLQAKIGINVTSPTAALEVSGTISATALVLNGIAITGGAGTFASLTDVSYSASAYGGNVFGPGSLTGAVNNPTATTAYGVGALASTSLIGTGNSAFGLATLRNNSSGNYNSALGANALNANTTGSSNNAFGVNALKGVTTGSQNVAMGNNALVSLTTASQNTAIGIASLYNLTTGYWNAALGFNAGFGVTTGGYNTLMGGYAGQGVTGGSSNTLIGYNAGGGITTGNNNIVIGASISPYSNTNSNQLAIANAIWGDTGNGNTLQAKIGINVTSPTASLEVSGTVSATTLTISSRGSVIGISGTAGLLKFARAIDGSAQGAIGYYSASDSTNFATSNSGGQSVFTWNLNLNGVGGSTEVLRINNDGHLTVGAASATSIIGFKRGSDGTEAGRMGYVSATDPYNFTFRNATGQGYFAWLLTPDVAREIMRLTPWGQLSIGISPTTMGATSIGLQVSGTVSATRFIGDGSGLTGIAAAANDNITSGTAYVKALQDTGASVSGSLAVAGPVSATGDMKGNTLQLVNAPADSCSTANAGALKRIGSRFYFCRP